MSDFKQIDVAGANLLITEQGAVLVDIRDIDSFTTSHAETAIHLTNDTIVSFMNEVEFDDLVLVMCYHGVSSQGAAQYLSNQGFENVYSVDGGFSAWHASGLPLKRG